MDTTSRDELGGVARAVDKMRTNLKIVMEEYEKGKGYKGKKKG